MVRRERSLSVAGHRDRSEVAARKREPVAERKASDLFVECLEAEGVQHVFGIPGEETLDLNESLEDSSIAFVPVRHEQGGAYMADMYGRLTQRAGVCLGTLGPGATNLVTGVADAFLDRSPLVALTGQADLERMHKESHQHIDVVSMFRPVTKWNARLNSSRVIPEVVRKAFKVAAGAEARPDAHRAARGRDGRRSSTPSRCRRSCACRRPEPSGRELLRGGRVIRAAASPIMLAGNGVARTGAAPALREFARATGIGVAETFMGKGVLDYEDPRARGTVGLQSRDYALAGFEDADVVITVGYDLVEHAPRNWNPLRDKRIVAHRHGVRRGRRALHDRGRPRRRPLPHPLPPDRGAARLRLRRGRGAVAPQRHRARALRGRPRRRRVPHAAAAGAVGDPPGARAAGHARSPTSACTSCGSRACSPRTSPTR